MDFWQGQSHIAAKPLKGGAVGNGKDIAAKDCCRWQRDCREGLGDSEDHSKELYSVLDGLAGTLIV